MQVEIVTPVGERFRGEAVALRARTQTGEVGVLPGHRDMLTALGVGVCQVQQTPHGDPLRLLLVDGYLQVSHGGAKIIIVTELAERREDIDPAAAQKALDAASAELAAAREDIGSQTWQVKRHAVELARARLELAGAA